MINLLLAANCYGESIEFLIKNTNWQDFAITVVLCITGAVIIYKVCGTIVELSHKKKDESTKQILEDFLKNNRDIVKVLKEKIAVSNAEDVSRKLLNSSNSDFIKRVSDEVCRLNTKEIIKEELNKMIDEKGSEFIKSISEKVHPVNNNLQK